MLLLLLQILLLDRLVLLGTVTPMIYILFILILDTDMSPVQRMVWGVCAGLANDVFMNTLGINAASMTLLAYLQPPMLRLFVTYERRDNINPGIVSMGLRGYVLYVSLGSLLFSTVYILLRTVALDSLLMLVLRILASAAISVVLILAVEFLFRKNQRRHFR